MTNVRFKLRKPQIISKEFKKNAQGNYDLVYGLEGAHISNASPNVQETVPLPNGKNYNMFTTIKSVIKQQQNLKRTSSQNIQKIQPLTNTPKVMQILNTPPCG
jgi:hypothetical protein